MIRVARNSWNTLVFKKVTVGFRERPGRGPEGAIERATYTLHAGITMVAGATRSDGTVTIRVPAGGTTDLEIFGSRYRIGLGAPLEPAAQPEGTRRRLEVLGYRSAPPESGVQDFQADQKLDPAGFDNAGSVDERTRDALDRAAGAEGP